MTDVVEKRRQYPKQHLSDYEKDIIAHARDCGYSYSSIGRMLGRTATTIREAVLIHRGHKRPSHHRKTSNA